MTTIARPNKEALTKVIDIYRDAIRQALRGGAAPAFSFSFARDSSHDAERQ